MAGLRWIRLDTGIMANSKVLAALDEPDGYRAVCVFMLGLAWIGQQDNAGFIPRHALRAFHASRDDAALLVAVGLWHADEGGWRVKDWAEYQPSGEEAQARSERARVAARARWDAPGNAGRNA